MFVPTYRYTVAEFDPAKPWLVTGEIKAEEVDLSGGEDFYDWAARNWPDSRSNLRRHLNRGAVRSTETTDSMFE